MRATTMATMAATAFLAAAILAGCGGSDGPPAPGGGTAASVPAATDGAAPAAALPADLFLKAKPEGGTGVGDLKTTAKEGDTVVLRGRIGGNGSPFVGGRAVMTLADPKLTPCSEMAMEDSCKKPWDYCCEDRAVLTANTATVEVDGPDGRPLKADLKGAGGLAELKTVTVVGVVAPRPDPAVLVVRAKGIFVE